MGELQFLGKILDILNAQMPQPQMYGLFHLSFFALSVILGVFLCIKFKNPSEKFVRKLLLIVSLTVIALEVYKMINYTFTYDGERINADFQWYAFPFQFCSTPMYVGFLAAVLRNKRVHEALCAYLATFALFAGFCVMFYPSTVFIGTIGINIQTMICHGSMVTVGMFLLGSGYVKAEHKKIIPAATIFAIFIVIALILNEIAFLSGLLETEEFNMFYISPHLEGSLPVYCEVQKVVPFPWCLFIYLGAFSLAAYIFILFGKLTQYLTKKFQK